MCGLCAQVVLHGATETKRSLNTFCSGAGMGGYGYRGWGGMGGMGTATTTESQYTVGTLVVDIFDKSGKSLLWRGTAQDELSDKTDKNIKKLGKASDKLFKDSPRAAPRSRAGFRRHTSPVGTIITAVPHRFWRLSRTGRRRYLARPSGIGSWMP